MSTRKPLYRVLNPKSMLPQASLTLFLFHIDKVRWSMHRAEQGRTKEDKHGDPLDYDRRAPRLTKCLRRVNLKTDTQTGRANNTIPLSAHYYVKQLEPRSANKHDFAGGSERTATGGSRATEWWVRLQVSRP